ncbi:uncharacterized protein LOC132796807 [Drosophila nasuta]|uniref:uncharacterized protein LOC132796807 n=1 Tax=Drosophila nasuta TaxID=42062 RepID=UPI00295E9B7E|nr:uncharacterized protein LOC132796807 [Drosophila nasuta]
MRIMMQLLLVLCMLLALGQPQQLLRRNIIKVRASGFLPFESDLLLPLGILRQLQAQDRASRLLPSPQQQLYRKSKPKQKPSKPKVKQQVRLERAKANAGGAGAGVQMYNLIDDDGELLLNLRVHNEMSHIDQHLDAAPQSSNHRLQEAELATPWRPSKWRPTARPPLTLTSSSPRPLPLHQYLSSNSLEQSQQQSLSLSQLQSATTPTTTQQQQQRRVFGGRQDWRSYQ